MAAFADEVPDWLLQQIYSEDGELVNDELGDHVMAQRLQNEFNQRANENFQPRPAPTYTQNPRVYGAVFPSKAETDYNRILAESARRKQEEDRIAQEKELERRRLMQEQEDNYNRMMAEEAARKRELERQLEEKILREREIQRRLEARTAPAVFIYEIDEKDHILLQFRLPDGTRAGPIKVDKQEPLSTIHQFLRHYLQTPRDLILRLPMSPVITKQLDTAIGQIPDISARTLLHVSYKE